MDEIKMGVRVIKKWGHSPVVKLELTKDGQTIQMDIEPFVEAMKAEMMEHLYTTLADEIGSVTWVFRHDTFKKMVEQAIDTQIPAIMRDTSTKVIRAIKQQSIYNFVRRHE